MSSQEQVSEWPVEETEKIMTRMINLFDQVAQENERDNAKSLATMQRMCASTMYYTLMRMPSVIPIDKHNLKRSYAEMMKKAKFGVEEIVNKRKAISNSMVSPSGQDKNETDKITVGDCFNFQEWYHNGDKWVKEDEQPVTSKKVITFENVIGQETAKDEIRNSFIDSLLYENLFGDVKRNILMWGPPGTGKTTIAKAMIYEITKKNIGVVFVSVSGASLKSKYVGESEQKIHKLFQCAEMLKTQASSRDNNKKYITIIFIDEIENLAADRNSNEGTGASGNTVNQLLTEMDGFEKREGVYVIAASNQPWMIDDAIIRRLHKSIYIGGIKDENEFLQAVQLYIGEYYKKIFIECASNEQAYEKWINLVTNNRTTFEDNFTKTIENGGLYKSGLSGSNVELAVKRMLSSSARNITNNEQLFPSYHFTTRNLTGICESSSLNKINVNRKDNDENIQRNEPNSDMYNITIEDTVTNIFQRAFDNYSDSKFNTKPVKTNVDKGIIREHLNLHDYEFEGEIYKFQYDAKWYFLVESVTKMPNEQWLSNVSVISKDQKKLYYFVTYNSDGIIIKEIRKLTGEDPVDIGYDNINFARNTSRFISEIEELKEKGTITKVVNRISTNKQNWFILTFNVPDHTEFYRGIESSVDKYTARYKQIASNKEKEELMKMYKLE